MEDIKCISQTIIVQRIHYRMNKKGNQLQSTDIEKFAADIQNIYKLKTTYRYTDHLFDWEKDSTAAHSWSMTILADYFLDYLENIAPWKYKLDKLKIYEYIIYHDLVEAESGDVNNSPAHIEEHNDKKLSEEKALEIFTTKIPQYIWKKLKAVFQSYEKREDMESKYVEIIDVLEWCFQCFHRPEMWKEWDFEHFQLRYLRSEFDDFPELKDIMNEILKIFEEKWYFEK